MLRRDEKFPLNFTKAMKPSLKQRCFKRGLFYFKEENQWEWNFWLYSLDWCYLVVPTWSRSRGGILNQMWQRRKLLRAHRCKMWLWMFLELVDIVTKIKRWTWWEKVLRKEKNEKSKRDRSASHAEHYKNGGYFHFWGFHFRFDFIFYRAPKNVLRMVDH